MCNYLIARTVAASKDSGSILTTSSIVSNSQGKGVRWRLGSLHDNKTAPGFTVWCMEKESSHLSPQQLPISNNLYTTRSMAFCLMIRLLSTVEESFQMIVFWSITKYQSDWSFNWLCVLVQLVVVELTLMICLNNLLIRVMRTVCTIIGGYFQGAPFGLSAAVVEIVYYNRWLKRWAMKVASYIFLFNNWLWNIWVLI